MAKKAKRHPARPRHKTKRQRAVKLEAFKPSVEPLPAAALRWHCDPKALPFDSTADIEPISGVIGQDSAVDALKFGLETNAPGQNVFVRGITGTGRMTLIRRMLEQIRLACPAARDRCYIHNFVHPDRPRLLTLHRGQGKPFQHRMDELADFIRDDLKAAVSSQAVVAKRTALEQELEKRVEQIIGPFEKALHDAGLALMTFQVGAVVQSDLVPRVNGKPVASEEFEQMHAAGQVTDEQVTGYKEAYAVFQPQFQETAARINEIRGAHAEKLNDLWKDEVRSLLTAVTDRIAHDFPGIEVRRFLDEIIDDVVNRRRRAIEKEIDFTRVYRINPILAHEDGDSCEIIVENTPTMSNLLGSIDHTFTRGEVPHSDHLMIRAGSLLRADGGYLVLEARDVLREPGAWHFLMRTLRTGRLEIVPPELVSPWAVLSLKPEPIDINVKVILLGESDIYYMLDEFDSDFPDLFKVLADFARVVPHDEKGLSQYAGVLARIAKEEGLLPFDRTAVAALIEHGARIAADKGKLTTRFGRLADIAREASFICNKEGSRRVSSDEVAEAVRRTKQRADLPSRRFREMIADGTIRIETSGTVVGQINGLAVISAGPLIYGFPARITATIGPGTAGVINIERESSLSGSIHTKGFYILGGLMRHLLRTVHPLVFDASIAFEQSYGGIDGDSASGAEICCMLSALTEIPLRQDLAMTGAIDQVGHILAIGAVNEKIEGFFDTCRDVGLTGAQGVIIPASNAGDLMLREDVVRACTAGWFHVHAVNTIQEALECLTLMPAGVRGADGRYPEDSVLGAAVLRAWLYWVKVSQTPVAARRQPAEPTVPRVPARRKPRRAPKPR